MPKATSAKLLSAAYAVDAILSEDYHDRIEDKTSISANEYRKICETLSKYASRAGVTYVYAYVRIDGKLYTTASSFTEKDWECEKITEFFYPYECPMETMVDAFDGEPGVPVFDFWEDPEFGPFYTAFIPLKSPGGKTYLVGADIFEIPD